jgi:F-type H+-transporting ATPase subunit epsilon
MMSKLHFELVSPEKLVASRDVHMVVVPGSDGDFGVLAGHAPMMSTIRDGVLAIYAEAGSAPETLAIRGGFAEVSAAGLTILAESIG